MIGMIGAVCLGSAGRIASVAAAAAAGAGAYEAARVLEPHERDLQIESLVRKHKKQRRNK
jgi:hypothetical protein